MAETSSIRSLTPFFQASNSLIIVTLGAATSRRPYIAANRLRLSTGTSKAVSDIPRGSNSRSRRNAPSGLPETTSITRAATSIPTLYRHCDPGWKARGSCARSSITVSSEHWASKSLARRYMSRTGKSSTKWYVRPLVWVMRSRTKMGRVGLTRLPSASSTFTRPNAGIYFASGSMSAKRPSSNNVISAVQMMGLVIEYRRKIVSADIGDLASLSRQPNCSAWTTLPATRDQGADPCVNAAIDVGLHHRPDPFQAAPLIPTASDGSTAVFMAPPLLMMADAYYPPRAKPTSVLGLQNCCDRGASPDDRASNGSCAAQLGVSGSKALVHRIAVAEAPLRR